jgi:internalin A
VGELAVASFYQSGITDLAPLAANQRLASLELSANPLVDLSPLAGLPNLAWLSMSNDRVTDAAPLARLPALSYLNVSGNLLGALELDDAQHLRVISAGSNQLTRFHANTERLEELYLGSNRLEELTLDAPVLTALDVSGNTLTRLDLTAPSLSSATLLSNELSTLAGLEGCPHLERLNVGSNPLLDISALEHLSDLWQLELSGTGISSSALVHLTQLPLGYLGLGNNPIDDISALATAAFARVPTRPNLYLDLSQTLVSDLSPLVQNPSIDFWSVGLRDCPLDCAAQADNLAALAARGVTVLGACEP